MDMKAIIIAGSIVIVIFILFQSYSFMSTSKTEVQKYSVVQKERDFEIRFYPAATIATLANPDAGEFMNYLQSAKAKAIFEEQGFLYLAAVIGD